MEAVFDEGFAKGIHCIWFENFGKPPTPRLSRYIDFSKRAPCVITQSQIKLAKLLYMYINNM